MHPTQIPYDICVSIINELALQGHHADIRAFSQTCRSLLHPCRARLFSTIRINENASQFAVLLKRNPTIKDHVRNLTYHPMILSKDVANALLLLDNIQTLVLSGSSSWESLTPHIQHALIHLFSSPSVTRIDIRNSSLPVILLSSCSNLKQLKLEPLSSLTSQACDIILKAPPKLLFLDVTTASVDALLNHYRPDGLPMLDLSSLRSLTIWIQSRNHNQFLQQILRLTTNLNHLGCIVIDRWHEQLSIALPTLYSLKITLTTSWDISLRRLLEIWTSQSNRISEISIILYTRWSDAISVDQGWLDHLLADRSSFPQLVKLGINIHSVDHDERSDSEKMEIQAQVMEFKTTKFPQLSSAASNYLDFQFSVDSASYDQEACVNETRQEKVGKVKELEKWKCEDRATVSLKSEIPLSW